MIPDNWSLFMDLTRFPDMPMHLLFLGIVKTVITDIMVWLKLKGKHTAFFDMSNGILAELQKLNLSWMKILPFINGKLGGWVAENYLAMSRIMGWFFELLDLLPEPEPYTDPTIDVSKYIKKQSMAWLKARGLDTKGNAKELKERVKNYNAMDEVPPILPVQGCSSSLVIKTIKSLQGVISTCMTLRGRTVEKLMLESSIRIFLTNYAEFESSIYAKRELPRWISS